MELDFAHFVLLDKGFELFSETARICQSGEEQDEGQTGASVQFVFFHLAGRSIRKFAIAYNLLNIAHHSF